MRILHIATNFDWSNIFILPVARCQAKLKNDVWISTPNSPDRKIDEHIYTCSWNKKYSQPLKYLLSAVGLVRKVKSLGINVVYAHTSLDSFIHIIFIRCFTSAKIKYINHGVPYDGYSGILRYILALVEMSNVSLSHKTFTITKSMVPLLQKVNFLNKNIDFFTPGTLAGVSVVYETFSELLQHRVTRDEKVILFVGRVEKRKGILELIDAIKTTKLDCRLIIVGEDSNNLLKDLHHPRIEVKGYCTNLSDIYLSSDYLCVPSHHEGFGQVYLEAASYGVIPICSDIPGPTDFIINNNNGFCVTPNDYNSITNLFNQISENKFDIESIQYNAYMSSKLFDSNSVIPENVRKLYL